MNLIYRLIIISKKQYKEISRRKTFYLKIFFHTPISILLPSIYFLKYFGGTEINLQVILFKLLLWNIVYFSGIETLNILQREINNGSIPYIMGSPTNLILWIIGSSMTPSIMFILSMLIYFLLIISFFNVESAMLFYSQQILLLIPFSISVNILISSITLLFKKTFNIINLLFDITYILVGVYYSISQLPYSFQVISKAIPLNYSFNEFIYGNYSNLFLFIIQVSAFLVVSVLIYRHLEKRVKNNGSIYKY